MARITDAATNGSRLSVLKALRDNIAEAIDLGVPARDLASLSRRLMDLTEEIEKIESEAAVDDPVTQAASADDEPF